ncbi:MAG: aminodeoxychorismate lyase [Acetatifactor sp.]|nr:aminodeoxychorismate lyase [Acetatifactor sp.]
MKAAKIFLTIVGAALRVFLLLAAVYIIYNGATICYNYGYRIFTEPAVAADPQHAKEETVVITAKMKPLDIGNLLESKGLINDAKLFALQFYASEYREDFKPGTYTLNSAMTAEDMMERMSGANLEPLETAGTDQ